MFYITKGNEPNELKVFRQNIAYKKRAYNWDDCPPQVKKAIRTQLVHDQNGLCAYCTRKIDENCQIEHFYSRDSYSNKMFDYDNMLGVDNSRTMDRRFKGLCENGRGARPLQLSPLDGNKISGIYYLSDGTIKHDSFQNDIDNILKLNHVVFKNKRKDLLKTIKAYVRYSDSIDNLISTYKTSPFGGIVLYYLVHLKQDPDFKM